MIHILKQELLNIFEKLSLAINTKPFVPILGCYCFSGTEGLVYSYNDTIGISMPSKQIDLDLGIPAHVYIMARTLHKEVVIDVQNEIAKFRSGRTRFTVPTVSKEAFLFIPPTDRKKCMGSIKITKRFIRGLKICLATFAENLTVDFQRGVFLETHSQKQGILYSTDNTTVTKYSIGSTDVPSTLIVFSKQFCEALISLSKTEEVGVLKFNKSEVWCTFKTGVILYGKQPDVDSIEDLKILFKRNFKSELLDISESFKDSGTRSSLLAKIGNIEKVTLSKSSKGRLCITTETESSGKIVDIVSDMEAPDDGIAVTAEYLNRALQMSSKMGYGKSVLLFSKGSRFKHIISTIGE